MPRKDFHELSAALKSTLKKTVPPMVDKRVNEIAKKTMPLDHDDHQDDDAHPDGESSTQEQLDEFDDWMDGFGTDDDEVPSKEVSLELLEEISREIDEAQLQKVVNDMLRKRRLVITYSKEASSNVSMLSKRSKSSTNDSVKSRPIIFEVRYLMTKENLLAKQHHIRRHEKKRDNPDEVYSESKIIEVVRILYELGHEHKYITEIVVRRADGKFGAFSESDYKHLYMNDIEDLYLMCINGKLGLESYQQRVNLTALAITFPGIERKKVLTITSKPVIGLIYENSKKEKRVMIIKEIPKFCDATLLRVLKLVEKKNIDVKHKYEDPKLNDNDVEYLRFYEEYIKYRLRHQGQMRGWESYVNRRPLGLRGVA
ncbi:hypothetical protein Tco_0769994 [Tanacetum coccineum]|uniref:Uncharacterized protein n=1 Tax=Tanacetum coccineum TaxID=301880 RepID=A0ABQ4ZAX7_9ASTR